MLLIIKSLTVEKMNTFIYTESDINFSKFGHDLDVSHVYF